MNNDNFYQNITDKLHDGLYFVDTNRIITYWNEAAELISGFTAEEVIGKSCADNLLTHIDSDGNSLCKSMCPLAASIKDKKPREAEVYMHHKDGHRVPLSIRISPLFDDDGNVIGGIELFTDISNQKANELRVEELEKLTYLDHLTQLANRRFFEKELEMRLEENKRYGIQFGVLFIDIDHFKSFNDTYGHDIGDKVLQFIAKTFVSNSRPFDLFGRWGGEEFVGIIRNVDKAQLGIFADHLRSFIANSYIMCDGQKLSVTISLGGTLVHEGDDVKTIINRADDLLYHSKENGRNMLTLE